MSTDCKSDSESDGTGQEGMRHNQQQRIQTAVPEDLLWDTQADFQSNEGHLHSAEEEATM